MHFAQGRWSVEQIPLEQLVGPAAVVDVSAKCAAQPDYQVTVADLTAWEQAHGSLSGDDRADPDGLLEAVARRRRGISAPPSAERPRCRSCTFPGLHPDAATLAGRERRQGGRHRHGEHRLRPVDALRDAPAALRTNIPGLENLTNLDQLPAARRDGDRAADEDQGRQRRAAAGGRDASALSTRHPKHSWGFPRARPPQRP